MTSHTDTATLSQAIQRAIGPDTGLDVVTNAHDALDALVAELDRLREERDEMLSQAAWDSQFGSAEKLTQLYDEARAELERVTLSRSIEAAEGNRVRADLHTARAELAAAAGREQRAEVRAVQGVLDLMHDAGCVPETQAPDTILPHSNGYGTWFIPADRELPSTRALTAAEIVERIHARTVLEEGP